MTIKIVAEINIVQDWHWALPHLIFYEVFFIGIFFYQSVFLCVWDHCYC